ncbi:DUF4236 domain-containing protein [Sellimonas sp.]|uniref:DUF4236 domain-containing protein n=1 Tax=Sellimonas sp. TaxID=2021466 RepID=UPI00257E8B8E|nr:DUF4236 domain-containing protein [Sellimonas sp.]
MGWRFRKSFKIAPGVKLNLNKNSHSFTFGGKGAHYTINSKGKRTKTVGIPGTGLSYTETDSKTSNNHGGGKTSMSGKTSGGKSIGCLGWIGILILLCIALYLYALCWIPAIFVLIYLLFSKKYRQNRLRNSIICILVIITSLLVSIWLSSQDELNSFSVDWGKTEFYVGEETQIKLDPNPSDAEIEKLELSKNDIASLEYKDGKAIITFENEGKAALFFTANGDIDSSTEEITVIDKAKEEAEQEAAEEAKRQEELAQQQKEQEEALAAQQQKEQEEALAAQQQQAQEETASQEQTTQQTNEDPIVYITNTGSKYHRSSCRTLKKSKIEKHLSEVQGSYEPCGICHPPQ